MRNARLVLVLFGALWLSLACVEFEGSLPGGYVDLKLQCSDNSHCERLFPHMGCESGRCRCLKDSCPANCFDSIPPARGCRCVDFKTNPLNCGACGNDCAKDKKKCCSGNCIDAKRDDKNCGECGVSCKSGEKCCGGSCINVQNDPNNCGSCQTRCKVGESCCGGSCVDLTKDSKQCGQCGKACPASAPICCNGTCTNTDENRNHCGQCTKQCSASEDACCKGDCINTKEDVRHCGTCGTTCNPGDRCCGGACINIETTLTHCGACGIACSGSFQPNPSTLTQSAEKDGPHTLSFTFDKLQPPKPKDTLSLTVEIFGDFDHSSEYASVHVAGLEIGRVDGAGPQCNQSLTLDHTKTFVLPHTSIANGKLEIQVKLSDSVDNEGVCKDLGSQVKVHLSYGDQTCCKGNCVQLKRDIRNCGTCGTSCDPGGSCCEGKCCKAGAACCQGTCCQTGEGCCLGRCCSTLDSEGLGHNDSVTHLLYHPGSKRLLSGSNDLTFKMWDLTRPASPRRISTKTHVNAQGYSESLRDMALSPDGKILVTAGGFRILIWDLSNPAKPSLYAEIGSSNPNNHKGLIYSVAFHPKSNRYFASSSSDRTIKLWDINNPPQPAITSTIAAGGSNGHNYSVYALAYHPSGEILASGSYDFVKEAMGNVQYAQIRLWDVKDPKAPTFRTRHQRRGGSVRGLVLHPKAPLVAAFTNSGAACVWDTVKRQVSCRGLGTTLTDIAMDKDGDHVVLATRSNEAKIYKLDVANGTLLSPAASFSHPDEVLSVLFLPSGQLLTGSRDKSIRKWRTRP